MKTISTQKNRAGGLRKAMKHWKGGIEMLRYTGAHGKGPGDLDIIIHIGNP